MKDPNWRKCILRADSRNVIKHIPDNSVDFILTDPPYNLGKHSTGNIPLPGRSPMNNDVAEWDMIDFNPEEWADEFIRILKPTGNLFIFTSYNHLGRWYNCLDHKFDTTNFMIWHKTNPAPKIFKAGFLNSCEMIFTCWNKRHTWNFISQAEMHNFVESPICMRPERLATPKHPAQKPVSILKKMIEIASNRDDIIFDPFMGVGSMGVAAMELDRRFIGIEINANYFDAAKERIETAFLRQESKQYMKGNKGYTIQETDSTNNANESVCAYQSNLFDIDEFFHNKKQDKQYGKVLFTGLQPIIKWPGGKEKELKYILPNVPRFKRFFEPFVGGGAVFMAIDSEQYYINDLSEELISLYDNIAKANDEFYRLCESIDESWKNTIAFFDSNKILVNKYLSYRNGEINEIELKSFVQQFCQERKDEIIAIIGTEFASYSCILLKELETNLHRKMVRMHELELQKHLLPDEDLLDNIETAIKSAVYMNYRNLYNHKENLSKELQCALFFFMRNYAYSGMFRYSSKGEFNVPYGGIAYNSKLMARKLDYYRSQEVKKHFQNANLFNKDFEVFLRETNPTEEDFVFLDPPYDSDFSTYAQNAFTREDQKRLANYMINECRAKWMMVIKNTDFIYNLYNKDGISIRTFDKEYLVSFMNRNDKKVTHLLITNY
ncbi:MAG: DNA adenine methylase [Paludibacteraceae bacterium]|nr:DNA adenine methylase [Paludibacteraceae bacterium]